ncbi:MAG: UDP-N-acetylmuramoyl-tripeptide--D-alanyl-D-alanine ligase [Rubrivivax sp.]|nr:UDP-N-acetylmuramoyl-tripeptide--D-alanyl-D-alanine ligase [Rubrivivax sp.]
MSESPLPAIAEASVPWLTLAEAHALLPGSRVVGDGATRLHRVHSDTRTLRPGDCFVALRGERFDGHDYLPQAQAAGAVAALAETGRLATTAPGLAGLEVADTLAALQRLAAAWRARLPALTLIAVTGSNGKTTVTQMLAAMLRAAHGDAALATQGNQNNHIGVPLTLLRLRAQHRAAVLELGTNHAGEIGSLADLVRPTIALINNAQREHQEFLHGVEAVARENGSVISRLPVTGTLVLPEADAYTPLWRRLADGRRVLTFGFEATADVRGEAAWMPQPAPGAWRLQMRTAAGEFGATLQQPGRHNALNAVAAAACALAAGVPPHAIASGLAGFRPVSGRTRVLALQRDGAPLTLIDDSYNANPDSVRAAIELLASLPGPRWLVLGDMAEVGDDGPAFHAEVGDYTRARGIEHCWSAGPLCAGLGVGRHFADAPALAAALREAPAARSVLVKGSRSMRMEDVVHALQAAWAAPVSTAPAAAAGGAG